jgi:AbrB family looped-hinge helix DNA binding protein
MVDADPRTVQTVRAQVVVGPKGRVVIPAELRAALHLVPGDRVIAYVEEGRLVMERSETVLDSIRRKWAPARGDRSAVEELLEERRAEAAREGLR